jgi:PEP-CTERM motif
MTTSRVILLTACATLSVPLLAPAAVLFSDPAEALTNFTVVTTEADTSATPIDYSSLGIPEAPGRVPGTTLATTGFQLKANKGDATAAITGLNLVLGAIPILFEGLHTLEFYVWMNIPANAISTSEDFVAGVARGNINNAIYGNFRTSRGNGGWLLQGNDNGLAVDHRELDNGTLVYSSDAAGDVAPKFNEAFTNNLGGAVNEAGNEWVKVDVVFDPSASTTSFFMNNVAFGSVPTTNLNGFAWFGYEDPAASIGSSQDLSGIFDNIQVFEGNLIPEPSTLTLAVVALGGLAAGRRHRCDCESPG